MSAGFPDLLRAQSTSGQTSLRAHQLAVGCNVNPNPRHVHGHNVLACLDRRQVELALKLPQLLVVDVMLIARWPGIHPVRKYAGIVPARSLIA